MHIHIYIYIYIYVYHGPATRRPHQRPQTPYLCCCFLGINVVLINGMHCDIVQLEANAIL